jgi:hypothetical protein
MAATRFPARLSRATTKDGATHRRVLAKYQVAGVARPYNPASSPMCAR